MNGYYAGRADPKPFDPSEASALQHRIMSAPLTAEEHKIVDNAAGALKPHHLLVGGAVGAGVTTILGMAFGSEKHARNAAIGALLGVGLGFVGQTLVVYQVTSQIAAGRRAKYVAEMHHLTPPAGQ